MPAKCRAFTGLVYPDSLDLPENWIDLLRDSLGMWLISQLHTPDDIEDLETGAIKSLKPHHHLMYMHGNTVSPKCGREVFERFPWIVTPPQDKYFMVGSVRNLSRYFLHMDQPEKQQFHGKPEDLLIALNGFPLDLEREWTKADKRKAKVACLSVVRNRNIIEYKELLDYLMDEGDWDLFDFATEHTHLLQGYLWGARKG